MVVDWRLVVVFGVLDSAVSRLYGLFSVLVGLYGTLVLVVFDFVCFAVLARFLDWLVWSLVLVLVLDC